MMPQISLDGGGWVVNPVGNLSPVPEGVRAAAGAQGIRANIPGCVHTDLLRAGLIPDPLVGFNERRVQWIGEVDWEYSRLFKLDAELLEHERLDLVCEGLDTIAQIRLNGVEIGWAANMFHPHRFDLRGAAQPGPNDLAITFRSPLRHIRAEEARLGTRPINGDWDPYVFIRKSACNFGWDWAPKLATCGIWRPIRVEAWSTARLAAVRPLARREGERWRVDICAEVEWASKEEPATGVAVAALLREPSDAVLQAAVEIGTRQTCAVVRIDVAQPLLWWPRGMGEQPLYDLYVELAELGGGGADGCGLDHWSGRVGLREVRLNTDPDESGSRFQIEVNGRPVFCKGANWIPEGVYPGQASAAVLRERVGQAAAANMNMLRVWGGGSYEDEAFYAACDELGVMVWQDFMFACAMYPEEAPYPALVEAEARHQVSRLSAHPSVALWCGGNECVWAHESWGAAENAPWKERLGGRTWGAAYFFELLPRIVRELDPTRPYWANSPWSGGKGVLANDQDHGDRHTWDAQLEGYHTIVPRFCSEVGHQAPANLGTLARAVGEENLNLGSPALEHLQRATGGTARHIDASLAARYPTPAADFAEWHRRAQQTQAEALRIAIEWLAAIRPRCTGVLIWQFNDAWPSLSWSLIDASGEPKPAYFAVQEAFDRIAP